jgi:predicted TIM-barrel enzyme
MSDIQRSRWVFPVVHHDNVGLSISQANLAAQCGADGVFLISHNDRNDELFVAAREIKNIHPDLPIGINLLGESALMALKRVREAGLEMVWTDHPGVTSAGWTTPGHMLARELQKGLNPMFFGSVAFKYQPHDPEPQMAAQYAHSVGMIATTSGTRTGSAPEVDKVRRMMDTLRETTASDRPAALAVASGMTPENVQDFLPHVTHFLVATGVSLDMHHFNAHRLTRFIDAVHNHA